MHKFVKELDKIIEFNSDYIAYKFNEQSYTYGDIRKFALELAEALKRESNTPVILYGHKSVRMIISILACLYARRAYIPVDVYMPADRIKRIIEQAGSTLVLNNSKMSLNGIESVTLEELYRVSAETSKEHVENLNEIAYIIFTSGTTGEPKGVPISYDNLDNFVSWINAIIPNEEGTKWSVLNQASFSFDLSVADLYYALSNGHTLIPLQSEEMNNYSDMLSKLKTDKINMIVATPTFLKLLLISKEFESMQYPDLKIIYLCGELLEVNVAKKILERFPNLKLINAYGPTEATSAVSGIVINEKMFKEEYLPVGEISSAATKITIENGEIVLSGKSVFSGYLNSENKINSYKTGDLGEIQNGLLYCYGRKDNQIKYKGYRIELDDIEKNIRKLEQIQDVVVIAKFNDNTKVVKHLKAYVILKESIEPFDIKEKLNEFLPQYMIPSIIKILNAFPINNNGKIDRKKLSEL